MVLSNRQERFVDDTFGTVSLLILSLSSNLTILLRWLQLFIGVFRRVQWQQNLCCVINSFLSAPFLH